MDGGRAFAGNAERAAERTACQGDAGGEDGATGGWAMLLLFNNPAVTLPKGCELLIAEINGSPAQSISLEVVRREQGGGGGGGERRRSGLNKRVRWWTRQY
jgi:hypothetical protein